MINGSRRLAQKLAMELERRAEFLSKIAEDPVPEVSRHDLEEILSKNRLVFLYFTAEWCGPCITFLETFRDVALRLARPGVFFGRVDVDKSYSVADRYNIQHIPTIVIIQDGKVVQTIIGSLSREKLEETVSKYIARVGL